MGIFVSVRVYLDKSCLHLCPTYFLAQKHSMDIKNSIRSLLNFLHLDITKNLEYDRLTKLILKKHIKPNSCCIDIGCHKGEILDILLQYAPKGKHYAFEPLPAFHSKLKEKYAHRVSLFDCALAYEEGESTFQYVKNAPAYSGIKKRRYDIENPEIEEIHVKLKPLDKVITPDTHIDFIKIDVEGAEFGVLKGGKELLKKNKPLVIFECGIGGSDYYGTKPESVYQFLTEEIGLRIFTLKAFIKKKENLSQETFCKDFYSGDEYYFVATV